MASKPAEYLGYFFRGIAMGAADVVPGVSGGTIAFITGIYEKLLNSISAFDLSLIKTWKQDGFKAVWLKVNGAFLASLLLGIGVSLASLAKLIKYLLEHQPILLWAFFFGLVISSVILVSKDIKKWNASVLVGLIVGSLGAYMITVLPRSASEPQTWFIFIAGMIAICAMILPGISGSFLLLLLGCYEFIIGAIDSRDFVVLGIFAAGCITGLLSFSRVLKWMFAKFHDLTIAILTGVLIGSLNAIWPWKQILESVIIDGKEKVISSKNLLPGAFNDATGTDPQFWVALGLAIAGFLVIFVMERVASKNKK